MEINSKQLGKLANGDLELVRTLKGRVRSLFEEIGLKQNNLEKLINIFTAMEIEYYRSLDNNVNDKLFMDRRNDNVRGFIKKLIKNNTLDNFIEFMKVRPSLGLYHKYQVEIHKKNNGGLSTYDFMMYKRAKRISPKFSNDTSFFVLLDENGEPTYKSNIEGKLGGHCGNGKSNRNGKDGKVKYMISLRNYDLSDPKVHGTFVVGDDGCIIESRGQHNKKLDVVTNEEALKWIINSNYVDGIDSKDYKRENNFHISDMIGIDDSFVSKYRNKEKYMDDDFDDIMFDIKESKCTDDEILEKFYNKEIDLSIVSACGLRSSIDKVRAMEQ